MTIHNRIIKNIEPKVKPQREFNESAQRERKGKVVERDGLTIGKSRGERRVIFSSSGAIRTTCEFRRRLGAIDIRGKVRDGIRKRDSGRTIVWRTRLLLLDEDVDEDEGHSNKAVEVEEVRDSEMDRNAIAAACLSVVPPSTTTTTQYSLLTLHQPPGVQNSDGSRGRSTHASGKHM
ncbi:unnamed protein product [Ilex paraguariensis]|uniref:Uncharacterized protein n=1 Tax=Ilex paraguariensis TaxID=185542 RepID=A0ABC8U0J0_9AQUA